MNMFRITALASAIAAVTLLSACNRPSADRDPTATEAAAEADSTGPEPGFIAKAIDRELEKARKELHEGNITLNSDGHGVTVNGKQYGPDSADSDLPRAELTPQGDLLIEGRAVAIDDAQRALLLQYREQVLAIADAGIAIGGKGAGLAEAAIKQAVGAIFSGDTGDIERRVEAEAKKLEAEARQLCTGLPPMLETQQQLAASLPEFAPYANLTQADIDDCFEDTGDDGADATGDATTAATE